MIPSRSFIFSLHDGAMEMPAHSIDRPQRLVTALEAVGEVRSKRLELSSRRASVDEIALAHSRDYVEGIAELDDRVDELGEIGLDPELRIKTGSYAAALSAAGAALTTAESLVRGSAIGGETRVMLNRPGSHHAGSDYALGFCVFNNLAIAAARLLEMGLEKVAIFDFDAHHGNGTEEIFYQNPNVLTVSIHQSPFFPGSGSPSMRGAEMSNLNIPLSAGASDQEGKAAFKMARAAIRDFQPDAILLEAGLDAHSEDWTTGLEMSDDFYFYLGRRLSELQDELSCPMAIELGGGYTDNAVRGGFGSFLRGLD